MNSFHISSLLQLTLAALSYSFACQRTYEYASSQELEASTHQADFHNREEIGNKFNG
jgi:hypothetical protein